MEIQEAKINLLDSGGSKKKFFILVSLLFVLIILNLLYIYFNSSSDLQQDSSLPLEEKPRGEIYLTLSPLEEEKPNIYKLDVETMELEEVFPDSEYRNYSAKYSSDSKNMLFVRLFDDNLSQILLFNETTGDLDSITSASKFFPRDPVFSSDNASIAYWVYEGVDKGLPFGFGEKAEDHKIYVSSLDGVNKHVADGVLPMFLPSENSILFLKDMGIYFLNLETGEENLILDIELSRFDSFEEEISNMPYRQYRPDMRNWMTTRFNFCANNQRFIVTDTLASDICIYQVSSWSPFIADLIWQTEVLGPNWPVFSPGCNYFVMQEFETQDIYSSKAVIYNVENFSYYSAINLNQYEPNNIWVSDWIIR